MRTAYKVRVRADNRGVDLVNVKMSRDPFCDIAAEEAVRLKEKGVASESSSPSARPPPRSNCAPHWLWRHPDGKQRRTELPAGCSIPCKQYSACGECLRRLLSSRRGRKATTLQMPFSNPFGKEPQRSSPDRRQSGGRIVSRPSGSSG